MNLNKRIVCTIGCFLLITALGCLTGCGTSASLVKKGIELEKAGRKTEALNCYNRAIADNPKNAQAYFKRGTLRQADNDLEGAIKDYSRAVEIQPDFLEALFNRGTARAENGETAGAINDFSRVIAINPNNSMVYLQRGHLWIQNKEYET